MRWLAARATTCMRQNCGSLTPEISVPACRDCDIQLLSPVPLAGCRSCLTTQALVCQQASYCTNAVVILVELIAGCTSPVRPAVKATDYCASIHIQIVTVSISDTLVQQLPRPSFKLKARQNVPAISRTSSRSTFWSYPSRLTHLRRCFPHYASAVVSLS